MPVVLPEGIQTNITKNSGLTSMPAIAADAKMVRRLTTARQAARIILEGIRRERPRILVGSDAVYPDAFSRIAPTGAANYMNRMMAARIEDRPRGGRPIQFRGG